MKLKLFTAWHNLLFYTTQIVFRAKLSSEELYLFFFNVTELTRGFNKLLPDTDYLSFQKQMDYLKC